MDTTTLPNIIVSPPPQKYSYDGPPLSEVYPQFFGQTNLTTDCACRCLWLLLTLSNNARSTYEYVPYKEFYQEISWLDASGFYMFDIFRLLKYFGFQHRITFPTEIGTYIIAARIKGSYHCVLFSNGKLYDPAGQFPVLMELGELKELISQPLGDLNNVLVISEIY